MTITSSRRNLSDMPTNGYHFGFVHYNRAWYSKDIPRHGGWTDEVVFGLYADAGGTGGEMAMRWYQLSTFADHRPTPRLECFSDSWRVLWEIRRVVKELAHYDGQHITPEEFCAILKAKGFQDDTPEEKEE